MQNSLLRHCPVISRSAAASQPGQLAAYVLAPSVAVPSGTARSVAPGALAICSGLLCLARQLITGQCLIVAIMVGAAEWGCANDPLYVSCGTADMADVCTLDTANATGTGEAASARGSLHVPVMPPDATLTKRKADLQAAVPSDVIVPTYRIDEYDLSVEYIVRNLDDVKGQFKIQLNGANEVAKWDPLLAPPADDEAPATPPLAGNIPTDIAAKGEVIGVFREDQLLEAAIDLDQISRANINPFAATLTINKNDLSMQPLTRALPPPPGTTQAPMQTPTGSPVPRSAFRQLVRVDLVLQTLGPHLTMDYALRIRPHTSGVIHDHGMDAPANEIMIYDPPGYVP